jgi:hypothetical protein
MTIGAPCACDGEANNCIAVSAVVASSRRRRFVMMVWIPGKILAAGLAIKVWRSTNRRWAGLWRASNADFYLFLRAQSPNAQLFITHSGGGFKSSIHIVPRGISGSPGFTLGSERAWLLAESVAGECVRGPSGPRTGSSSGIRPGNSSGCGGSPGSWIGGGISGCGLPGGFSGGGSDGLPGVAGGISGGSMGIYSAAYF